MQSAKQSKNQKLIMHDPKPCPFCSSTVKLIHAFDPMIKQAVHFIDCTGCGVSTKLFDKKEDALGCWNNRAKTNKAEGN